MNNKSQFRIHPLTAAVSAALGTGTPAIALAQKEGERVLEEVIVTATKIEQNQQDIPTLVTEVEPGPATKIPRVKLRSTERQERASDSPTRVFGDEVLLSPGQRFEILGPRQARGRHDQTGRADQ